MRSDPIYLFQELTWKASLGVLSVAGNVCKIILAEIFGVVKVSKIFLISDDILREKKKGK